MVSAKQIVLLLIYITIYWMLIVLPFTGCIHLNSRDLNKEVKDLTSIKFDSLSTKIGRGLTEGIKESALDEKTKNKFDSLAASLSGKISVTARDSLLNETTRTKLDAAISQIISTATGKQTHEGLESLLNSGGANFRRQIRLILEDNKTAKLIGDLIQNHLLGDSTLIRIDSLREHFAGLELRNDMTKFAEQLQNNYKNILDHTKKEITSVGSQLFWALLIGTIVLMVIGTLLYIWMKRYQNLSKILTNEIHYIPNQTSYDELTKRITKKSRDKNLESHLNNLLREQSYLGQMTGKRQVMLKTYKNNYERIIYE